MRRAGFSSDTTVYGGTLFVTQALEPMTAWWPMTVSPPHIGPLTKLADMFAGAEEKSKTLAAHYRDVATQLNGRFVDSAGVVQASPVDGVHLDEWQHERLGRHLAEAVRALRG